MKDKDVVMTLHKSLLPSYEYFIITLEMMLMTKLTMKYVMACLMHEMLERKGRMLRY